MAHLFRPGGSAFAALESVHYDEKRYLLCLLLAAITLVPFFQATSFEFINYDDPAYVIGNSHVNSGLSLDNLTWALTALHGNISYWHPLTWLSHQIDCQLFGFSAPGHHVGNILLHTANTVLVFLVLQRYTGVLGRSAAVAALFSLHPLHVESVAWISERKDVLCAFFWLLALLSYAKYVSQPSRKNYLLVNVPFVLALMSKPSAVSLPCVLLLLDFWPLARFQTASFKETFAPASGLWRCVVEKLPIFGLSAALAVVTMVAQSKVGAMVPLGRLSIPDRLVNAAVAYESYLRNATWPDRLYVPYTLPIAWPITRVVVAVMILFTGTAFAIYCRRRRPFVLFGWFWFLITLVPMIGLVQVGAQAFADRYSYLPSIGLFIIGVWGISQCLHSHRQVLPFISIGVIASAGLRTHSQLQFWRSSKVLFSHTLALDPGNATAHINLGLALENENSYTEASRHYKAALENYPLLPLANFRLGELSVRSNLFREASVFFANAIPIDPSPQRAHSGLGLCLIYLGETRQALLQFEKAIQIDPDLLVANQNLSTILATDPHSEFRDGARAVLLADRACRLSNYRTPECLDALAASYAEAGQFTQALDLATRARDIARRSGKNDLVRVLDARLRLYRQQKPVRAQTADNLITLLRE